jgi:arylformamidase
MNPAIESQFNPRTTVPDVGIYTSRGDKLSAEARARYKFESDVRYGKGPLADLDFFPAKTAGRPLVVFLHGGYWRARDKKDYSFVVNGLIDADCSVAVMNYDLCPAVKLSEIVQQVKDGLVWLTAQSARWGFDPKQIFVSGHSAGAHLLAAVLAQTGQPYQLPAGIIKKAYLLSGVYDVEPVLEISVNEEIRLLPEEVHAMSPLRFKFSPETSYEILVGGGEPRDWIRESSRFAEHLKNQGCAVYYQTMSDLNHYSLMFEFETPEGFISARIRQDIEASKT